jgi:purine-binding chemotaxis protein CheW
MAGSLVRGKGDAAPEKGDPVPASGGEDSRSARSAKRPAAPPPRAGLLARAGEATGGELQVVTFRLAEEEYAIDILQVQEIVMMTTITRMPRAPEFIEGIVNLRGQMIPIINLRRRLGLSAAERTKETRIVIAGVGGEMFGMIVDAVREVTRLPQAAISPPPAMIAGVGSEFLTGIGQVGDRVLIMLDLAKVLCTDELSAVRQMQNGTT